MISRRQALAGLGASGAWVASGGAAFAQTSSYGRIVSVGGAITETLFALGLGDSLRAADTTSTFPPQALQLPKVGYLRQLSAEGVLAMRPDLIVLSGEAGPAAAVEQMKSSGLPVAQIEIGRTPDAVASMVQYVGTTAGEEAAADELAQSITSQFSDLSDALPSDQRKSVLLILSVGNGPLLGAGADTAASAMIELAGGVLAFPDMQGYKPISLEPVLAADPAWIVLPSHVAMTLGGPKGIGSFDVIARTRAGQEGRVAVIDSHYLLGFGPRAPQAAADLASLLHPDIEIPNVGRDASPSSLVTLAGV